MNLTDEEKLQQVTAKLAGEFYVGQRVMTNTWGSPGEVMRIGGVWIYVRLEDGTQPPYLARELSPL